MDSIRCILTGCEIVRLLKMMNKTKKQCEMSYRETSVSQRSICRQHCGFMAPTLHSCSPESHQETPVLMDFPDHAQTPPTTMEKDSVMDLFSFLGLT